METGIDSQKQKGTCFVANQESLSSIHDMTLHELVCIQPLNGQGELLIRRCTAEGMDYLPHLERDLDHS